MDELTLAFEVRNLEISESHVTKAFGIETTGRAGNNCSGV